MTEKKPDERADTLSAPAGKDATESACESCCHTACPDSPGVPVISLRKLEKGQKARIACVRAEGELGRRIRDMGLIPGAELEIVGRAPLRDPVAVRLPGFTISLRNKEADYISVTPLP